MKTKRSSTYIKPSKSAATNAMLLSVSFYVIFTMLPASLVYVMVPMFPKGDYFRPACHPVDMSSDPTWRRHVVYLTARKIVEEICLTHYACNFFFFAITGIQFRRELCRMLGCCKWVSIDRGSSLRNHVTYTLLQKLHWVFKFRPADDARRSACVPSTTRTASVWIVLLWMFFIFLSLTN